MGYGPMYALRPPCGATGYSIPCLSCMKKLIPNFELKRPGKRMIWAGALVVLLLGVVGMGVGWTRFYSSMEIPDLASLRVGQHPDLGLATVVYTADGEELTRFYRENRTWVQGLSPHVLEALVATEDRRFYTHRGVDWLRLVSSVWKTAQGQRQGGSTITMQLVRNFYPAIGQAPTLKRKVLEIATALNIERVYLKHEILELYLNTVPFGFDAYGLEAASQTYFNKPSWHLNRVEAATLVGILKGNTRYNPVQNPDLSRRRRNVVLGQMVKYGDLDPAAFDSLRQVPLELDFNRQTLANSPAPYFAEYVRGWLEAWAAQQGFDLYADGLTVYTTLDSRLQRLAQAAVEEQTRGLQAIADYEWSRSASPFLGDDPAIYERTMARGHRKPFQQFWRTHSSLLDEHLRRTPRYKKGLQQGITPESLYVHLSQDQAFVDSLQAVLTRLEAGFVGIDPSTGHVLAWVGGRSFEQDQYDKVAYARRQPGSTFKPFLYAAALEAGRAPDEPMLDSVQTYAVPNGKEGETWTPTNAGGGASGDTLLLREGLVFSKNTITAQLMNDMGPQWVAHIARKMGFKSDLDEVPSLALGTSEVTLLELVSSYTPFATNGHFRDPIAVTRIEDRNGRVVASFASEVQQVLSRFTAYEILSMMRDVVDRGTGVRIRSGFGIQADVAGKTGTTQNGADGWFVMLHPRLMMGAWVGFNDRQVTFRSDFWGQGGHNALYIVGDFFQRALASRLYRGNTMFRLPRGYLARAETPSPDSLLLAQQADSTFMDGKSRDSLETAQQTKTARLALEGSSYTVQVDTVTLTPHRGEAYPSDMDAEQTMRNLLQTFDPIEEDTTKASSEESTDDADAVDGH